MNNRTNDKISHLIAIEKQTPHKENLHIIEIINMLKLVRPRNQKIVSAAQLTKHGTNITIHNLVVE